MLGGGHFQANDLTNAATTGGLIGTEIKITANGPDTNSHRYGIDLIAFTNPATGGAAGRFTAGLRIRNGGTSGKWINGILIGGGAEAITTGINIQNSSGAGGAGIVDSGKKDYGIRITGTYAGAGLDFSSAAAGVVSAVRLQRAQKIDFEATGTLSMTMPTATNNVVLQNGSTEIFGFNISNSTFRIATNPVVGARKTGWSIDTGTAKRTANATCAGTASAEYVQAEMTAVMNALRDATQTIKALKDDLHATAGHGLIGA